MRKRSKVRYTKSLLSHFIFIFFLDSYNDDDDDFVIDFPKKKRKKETTVAPTSSTTTSVSTFKKPDAMPLRRRGYHTGLYDDFKSETRGLNCKLIQKYLLNYSFLSLQSTRSRMPSNWRWRGIARRRR